MKIKIKKQTTKNILIVASIYLVFIASIVLADSPSIIQQSHKPDSIKDFVYFDSGKTGAFLKNGAFASILHNYQSSNLGKTTFSANATYINGTFNITISIVNSQKSTQKTGSGINLTHSVSYTEGITANVTAILSQNGINLFWTIQQIKSPIEKSTKTSNYGSPQNPAIIIIGEWR